MTSDSWLAWMLITGFVYSVYWVRVGVYTYSFPQYQKVCLPKFYQQLRKACDRIFYHRFWRGRVHSPNAHYLIWFDLMHGFNDRFRRGGYLPYRMLIIIRKPERFEQFFFIEKVFTDTSKTHKSLNSINWNSSSTILHAIVEIAMRFEKSPSSLTQTTPIYTIIYPPQVEGLIKITIGLKRSKRKRFSPLLTWESRRCCKIMSISYQ